MKEGADIIPLEFIASMVEPILTPRKYQFYYSDKNNFNKLLPEVFMPKVFLMNIDGFMYDGKYNLLKHDEVEAYLRGLSKSQDRIVLKPSRQASGVGVQILKKDAYGNFANGNGRMLSLQMLKEDYGANYLLQECLNQSDYMSQFNSSSINTIRIATYRDGNGRTYAYEICYGEIYDYKWHCEIDGCKGRCPKEFTYINSVKRLIHSRSEHPDCSWDCRSEE